MADVHIAPGPRWTPAKMIVPTATSTTALLSRSNRAACTFCPTRPIGPYANTQAQACFALAPVVMPGW